MQYNAVSVEDYFSQLPEERKAPMQKLWETIKQNLPEEFSEDIAYGMIGFVIPHSLYPDGYHCDPKQPLPFMGIASQKNFIALYHMGIYADKNLLSWFVSEYPKYSKTKLHMGKSCIRFKKPDQIPFELIAELTGKMSADQWISIYENRLKK